MHNATLLNIEHARGLLHCLFRAYIDLYGEKNLSFTFHMATKHLVDDVVHHGSLISHSIFSLESTLEFLSRAIYGTRGFSNQYVKGNYSLS